MIRDKTGCAGNVGDLGLIPGLGRSPGEVKGYPLQYSGLENSMDCVVHESQSWTQLSNFHLHSRNMALRKLNWRCIRSGFPNGSVVKNLFASAGREDPLEK